MDRRVIDVHGVMRTGNLDGTGGRWKLQVFVDIYGPPSSRLALGPHLSFFGEVSETGIPPYENATQVDGTSRSPSKGGNKKGKRRMLDDDEETEQEKEARLVIENLKNLDKGEGRNDKVMEELMKGFDVLKMPLHPNPPSKKSGEFRNDLLVRLIPFFMAWPNIHLLFSLISRKAYCGCKAARILCYRK